MQNTTTKIKRHSIYETSKAMYRLKAFGYPISKDIFQLLANGQSLNVTTITDRLGIAQAMVSQNLAIMRKAKIVIHIKKDKEVFYSLNIDNIEKITNTVNKFLNKSN